MRLIITFNNKNVILPEPWVQSGQPNNEIWYKSYTGVITPYRTSSLPTIVSNAYVDNKGVIKFATFVTSIGERAFLDRSGLTSIEIPNSVTSIGDNAFYFCRSLSSISYAGTIAQWNAITKGFWYYNVPATVVHCTDGDTPI